MSTTPPRTLDWESERELLRGHVLLIQDRSPEGERWILMVGRDRESWLNGLSLPVGIRILADRDEIRIDGSAPMFFSTERLAQAEAFPSAEGPIYCPRCKLVLEAGSQAVRCPGCEVWHHQSEDLGCWAYAGACALCPQPTSLEAGYAWYPELVA